MSRYTRSVHRGRVVTALAGQWGAIAPRIVGLLVLAVGVGLLTGPWWSSTLPAGDRPLVAPQKMLEELRGLDGNGYREVRRRMELRPVALGDKGIHRTLQVVQGICHSTSFFDQRRVGRVIAPGYWLAYWLRNAGNELTSRRASRGAFTLMSLSK